MRRRLVVAAAAVLLTAACGSHPDHGQVVAKDHRAAYSWMQMICSAYDPKTGACMGYVPIMQQEPECWRFTLANGDEKWQVCVDQSEWNTTGVGASWQEKP